MQIKSLSSLLACLLLNLAYGQSTESQNQHFLKINDLYLLTGVSMHPTVQPGITVFQELAPGSQILKEDFSDHSLNPWSMNSGSSHFNLMLGLQLLNPEKQEYRSHVQLRLGLSYSTLNLLSDNYFRESKQAFDTLISSRTGEEFYIDSIFTSSYNMNYYSDQLGISADMIWRTNPEARWSVYGGAGLSFAVSLNSYTQIAHHESSLVRGRDFHLEDYENDFAELREQIERYSNKSSVGFSVYAPFGIDWRIGKKSELLKHLHIFIEARPEIKFQQVLGQKLYSLPGFFQGVGIRYS